MKPKTLTPVSPVLQVPAATSFSLGGEIGRRLDAVTRQWILPAPMANPAMLEMFRNRERRPLQDQMAWAGEFAGKYLTHAAQIYRLTRDPALASHLKWFVGELALLQDADGYLGPWPKAFRMKLGCPSCQTPWDAWGHYHLMVGLLFWHQDTGDARALHMARRIGDYFCARFLKNPTEKLHDSGAHEMNLAPAHSLAMLYRVTGTRRYLDMANRIVREFEIPPAGDYFRQGLAGIAFWKTPKPRWESLHPIMALAELYQITGNRDYRRAFENLWWSMLKGDRHNNGGFTSGEKATGNPYDLGAIETCCTIAWMAMSVEMLKLTGNPVVADEIEFSLLNSGLGMMSPSGRWVTYNTPMDGNRRASADHIVFQARAGSPELNCCSVNGPRALGMISDWALMRRGRTVVFNYYGSGTCSIPLASGRQVRFIQDTDYPANPHIEITVHPDHAETFPLALRIPYWSKHTTLRINGRPVPAVKPATYCTVTRRWVPGDSITVDLDFTPHFWVRPNQAPADFIADWTVFGAAPPLPEETAEVKRCPSIRLTPALDRLVSVPHTLAINGRRYRPRTMRSVGGILSGRHLAPDLLGRMSLVAFTTLTSARARTLRLAYTADWWTAWYVNGVKVADNTREPLGNNSPLNKRGNTVLVPLKKGKNLLALVIGGGILRGAWASIGLVGVKPATGPGIYAASVYRGPLLLAYDPRYNRVDPHELPVLIPHGAVDSVPVQHPTWLKPALLHEFPAEPDTTLSLCDFASAGLAGNAYITWLPLRLKRQPRVAFSRSHPLPTVRY